jgi:hypothetical protein
VFDDDRVGANPRAMLPAELAGRPGIEALVDQMLDSSERPGAASPGHKVMTALGTMASGGDCIDHRECWARDKSAR